ncbi:MAG: type IV secretion system DNA-binding domain-containing protein [Planctomycetia bacterium]|nr:type IV secretion system DNA-binding domain-containing protein [Planctomycetia bacterium]
MGIFDKAKAFLTSPDTHKAIKDAALAGRDAAVVAGQKAAELSKAAIAEYQKQQEAAKAAQPAHPAKSGNGKLDEMKKKIVDHHHAATSDQHMRGSIVVHADHEKAIQMMRGKREHLQLQIGNVPIPAADEQQHFLLAGAPGTGKSVTIKSMLAVIRDREEKAIVFDPGGDMVSTFYRPGIDYILNPLDARDIGWNLWNDLERHEYVAFSKAIVPDPTGQSDPFWATSGQAVLQALLITCRDLDQLLYAGLAGDDSELMTLVRKAGKTGLVGQEKTFSGVRANLSGELDKLSVLRNTPATEALSLKQWVGNNHDKGWVFLSANKSHLESLKPLIRVWIDTVARAAMSLKPDKSRRIWSVIDELPSLGKIPALQAVMAEGRRFGLSSILGIQNTPQLRETYGKDGGISLLALPKTQLILRVADAETQDEMSKLLGEKQIKRTVHSHTPGTWQGGGSNSESENVSIERAVLPSEIGALPDLVGYLRIGGENLIARVRIPTDEIPHETEPGFIPEPQRQMPWEDNEDWHKERSHTSDEAGKV